MDKPKTNQAECSFYLYTITSFLILITLPSLSITNTPDLPPLHLKPTTPPPFLNFYPLKDPRVPPYTHPNKTWFMSTLSGRSLDGLPEHFLFPSPHHPYTLCIDPRNKSYALAPRNISSLPNNSVNILEGLTFIADSFYDYENPWHGLNVVSPFFSWMREKGRCERPRRWVLFKNGEVVRRVGGWVESLVRVGLGDDNKMVLDGLRGVGGGVVCFEKALVMRRGLGGMEGKKRNSVFEMFRCKAWRHCGLKLEVGRGRGRVIRVGLLGRGGKRGFRNESEVKEVVERVCGRVDGCRSRVYHFDRNMSFCDQVEAMKNTDILVSIHGAQLTNMMFMPKGSHVMEMYPTGWLESAGVGQYIYQWFANWTELHYEGAWRDPAGLNCSKSNVARKSKCFLLQKDQQVGVDSKYLADWMRRVVERIVSAKNVGEMEHRPSASNSSTRCSCD